MRPSSEVLLTWELVISKSLVTLPLEVEALTRALRAAGSRRLTLPLEVVARISFPFQVKRFSVTPPFELLRMSGRAGSASETVTSIEELVVAASQIGRASGTE